MAKRSLRGWLNEIAAEGNRVHRRGRMAKSPSQRQWDDKWENGWRPFIWPLGGALATLLALSVLFPADLFGKEFVLFVGAPVGLFAGKWLERTWSQRRR